MTPGRHNSRVHNVRLWRDITLAWPDLGTSVLDRLGPGVWSEEVSLSEEEWRHDDSRELKILPPKKITDSKLKTPIFDETHGSYKRIIIIILLILKPQTVPS